MSLCHTVYVIVLTHRAAYSYPVTMEELAMVQHYVTKETNTASSSREDVKDDILILQL